MRRCVAQPHARKRLEQLCRTITRPALSDERVQCNAAGQVVLELKPRGATAPRILWAWPLEFMQRLAALVPRPRLHLIRRHRVLSPNAKLRARVVPPGPAQEQRTTGAATGTACEAETDAVGTAQGRSLRIRWARLHKRVFEIEMQHCPNCGAGELRIIAAILERPLIEKILMHLGLQARVHLQQVA
jgi:hypothetical protein